MDELEWENFSITCKKQAGDEGMTETRSLSSNE